MANSSSFDVDSTLPDLDELLLRRPAAYTGHAASAALVQKPGDRQSNPIEVLDTPPPLRQVTPDARQKAPQAPQALSTPSWLRRP